MSNTGNDRQYWLNIMEKIAEPVLTHLAKGELREKMPVRGMKSRISYTHLEALGRLLAGMAPWLELSSRESEKELKARKRFLKLAQEAINAATDPQSPDYMNFSEGDQPLVDTAFLSQAVVRAPEKLWKRLPGNTKKNLVAALKMSRKIKPYYSNWLLFSAMVETALYIMGEEYDTMRIDYALRQHEQWYKGDGIYGDGPEFHWDYYNSFVIQPVLVDILSLLGKEEQEWRPMREKIMKRAQRYAGVLERLISPEGTFPPLGRSLTYRTGVFHLLAQMALKHNLPETTSPAQVRCALTAVIKRMLEAPGTFDKNGWLEIGFCGKQSSLGERYISTGSLYLCSTVFLPLGLPSSDEFWKGKGEDWTAKKIWNGQALRPDQALNL